MGMNNISFTRKRQPGETDSKLLAKDDMLLVRQLKFPYMYALNLLHLTASPYSLSVLLSNSFNRL